MLHQSNIKNINSGKAIGLQKYQTIQRNSVSARPGSIVDEIDKETITPNRC